MKHRIAAVAAAALLVVTACGGSDVTADEARRIIVAGLIDDAGLSRDVAECVADRALDRHEPSQLVNEDGTTTDAVNASVQAILADCLDELAPPPPTTVPPEPTPVPTTAPVDLTAYCTALYDAAVAFRAADQVQPPGPVSARRWFDLTRNRLESAVAQAPTPAQQARPLALIDLVERYRRLMADADFVVGSVPPDRIAELAPDIIAATDELSAFVEGDCGRPIAAADVAALADELALLDVPPTTVPSTEPADGVVEANHATTGIRFSVPRTWADEEGGVAATPFSPTTRYLIRSADLATFRGGSFDGRGVAVYAVDGTVNFGSFLSNSEPSLHCTIDRAEPYDDGVYVGTIQFFEDCDGSTPRIIVVGAADTDANVALYLELRVGSDADPAINIVLDSFFV